MSSMGRLAEGRMDVDMTELEVLVLDKQDVIAAGGDDIGLAVSAVEHVFACHARGETVLPPKTVLRWGGTESEAQHGRINAMPGYVGGRYNMAGIKWIGSHPPNLKKGLPRASGIVILNDPETKFPVAIMEASVISAMRTGAVTGVAAKYLSREDSTRIGVIGAGVQSRTQIRAVCHVRPGIRDVRVYDLDAERCRWFAEEMRSLLGISVQPVSTAQEAAEGVDILITATTADKPIVKDEWVRQGAFYSQVGGYEAEIELLLNSEKLVVDDWEEVMHRGIATPYQAAAAGRYGKDRLHGELGEVVIGKKPGRQTADERIFFNSVGMGTEDVAFATDILRNAQSKGIGRKISLWPEAPTESAAG